MKLHFYCFDKVTITLAYLSFYGNILYQLFCIYFTLCLLFSSYFSLKFESIMYYVLYIFNLYVFLLVLSIKKCFLIRLITG